MQKKFALSFLILISVFTLHAQDKFFTKSGKIQFFSSASLEDIEAHNKTTSVLLDSKTGIIQFSVLLKSFEFEKALMQEHFNSDYVESDKYPKAEFKGNIENNSTVNYNKPGTYAVKVKGQLTLHGVTHNIETNGTIKVAADNLETNASFDITLSDYNIKIQSMVKNRISKTIKINVDCKLEPLKT
ncbi:MAG TPA: YceI family protein [Flavisolibacter sp.]|jgi:polyisoprenoid-binding protein YceI|nr:YceI family protein [Flavisolibacter sp.]